MAQQVVDSATLGCSFGTGPSTLTLVPQLRFTAEGRQAANVLDCVPFENIPPFGECLSLANPEVAAATAAAGGELTPQPCVPEIVGEWVPGEPRVRINGQSALTQGSTCMCTWLGEISIEVPGTTRTEVL
jgi:hypothetical protein